MDKTITRIFQVDEDILEVEFFYDEESQKYFGEYPDFQETPRYTQNGKPWVNVTFVGCPYADQEYNDCGSCQHIRREQPTDLIGVCQHECCQIKNLREKIDA